MKKFSATQSEIKQQFIVELKKSNRVCSVTIWDFFDKQNKMCKESELKIVADIVAKECGFSSFEYWNHSFQIPGSCAKFDAAVFKNYMG